MVRNKGVSDEMTEFNDTQDVASITEQAIPSVFSDFDLYLFGQGKDYHIYEKMGAHIRTVNGVVGTNFASWAPDALAVSRIGGFSDWKSDTYPRQLRHR